jgi:hypothetical protein
MEKTYSNKSGEWSYQYRRNGTWFSAARVPVSVLRAAEYYRCAYIVFDESSNEARPADGSPCGLFRGAKFDRSRGYKPFFGTAEVLTTSREAKRTNDVLMGALAGFAVAELLKAIEK